LIVTVGIPGPEFWRRGNTEHAVVGRDLAAAEFQFQAAVKTDPQILVLAVTHWVPLSAWHKLAEHPCFSRVWRKSHAKTGKVIWEIRA